MEVFFKTSGNHIGNHKWKPQQTVQAQYAAKNKLL